MLHKMRSVSTLAVLSLALLGGAPSGSAQTTVKVLSIPPSALQPAGFRNNALPWVMTADAFYFANNLSAPVDGYAYAPLSLPHQARIKSLTVYYIDNACGKEQELVVALTRHDMATGKIQAMAKATTAGVDCRPERRTVEDLTIGNAVVDNDRYSYALTVLFADGIDRLRFLGAKIRYQ
ncbi:MAG: hypothetical protein JW742_02315 [Candidatus Aminicenantes bacterium]|nr:hypothetical protein [Candidatus Aminicenantes bacterium]